MLVLQRWDPVLHEGQVLLRRHQQEGRRRTAGGGENQFLFNFI